MMQQPSDEMIAAFHIKMAAQERMDLENSRPGMGSGDGKMDMSQMSRMMTKN